MFSTKIFIKSCIRFLIAIPSHLDKGVTTTLFRVVLVKGNPVEIRSYTRSCESIYAAVIYCHCPLQGGKVTAKADKPENLPIIHYVSINNASGEGLLTLIFYAKIFWGRGPLYHLCVVVRCVYVPRTTDRYAFAGAQHCGD